jgi:hypothetical protein
MNIELDEVVVLDVSDEALELAAGGAQRGNTIDSSYCWGGDHWNRRSLVTCTNFEASCC